MTTDTDAAHAALLAPFTAIDFETADNRADSACAIGIARVENLKIVAQKTWLIRPPRPGIQFTFVHGITWERVKNEPNFAELWPLILPLLSGVATFAAHNAGFDQRVLHGCLKAAKLPIPETPFECTVRIARQTWGVRPTKLPDVCQFLGLSLNHHDAGSDAAAAAGIVIAARRSRLQRLVMQRATKLPFSS